MLFGQNRDELRQMYVEAWRKARAKRPLEPLEAQIAGVVDDHPEYHDLLETGRIADDFPGTSGSANPFLHMSLHLTLRDQVKTDRPPGIRALYNRLQSLSAHPHAAEHRLLDCLAETLWEAQNRQETPDEQRYLERVRALVA